MPAVHVVGASGFVRGYADILGGTGAGCSKEREQCLIEIAGLGSSSLASELYRRGMTLPATLGCICVHPLPVRRQRAHGRDGPARRWPCAWTTWRLGTRCCWVDDVAEWVDRACACAHRWGTTCLCIGGSACTGGSTHGWVRVGGVRERAEAFKAIPCMGLGTRRWLVGTRCGGECLRQLVCLRVDLMS